MFFRGQFLNHADQKRLTRVFGEPMRLPYVAPMDEERVHPSVIRNPLSGREGIFLNPQYVVRLDGMNETGSRPLLDQIQRHATRPEFTCRWRWQAGDVAIWDNFFTQISP